MALLHVDPMKHQHPRRYRLALAWCLLGVVAGVAMTAFGLYLLRFEMRGAIVWFTSFVLIGPSIVFLSAVGFATYLENLESKGYGEVYHDEEAVPQPPS